MQPIDRSPTFVRRAREQEDRQPLGIADQVADGAALPFPSNAFYFSTAFMSLMDMPDQGLSLAEAARVLRPGGFSTSRVCIRVSCRRTAGCGAIRFFSAPEDPRGRGKPRDTLLPRKLNSSSRRRRSSWQLVNFSNG
jgi:ubiquinone/menaquinone biosynthesis C-methylase UbiE